MTKVALGLRDETLDPQPEGSFCRFIRSPRAENVVARRPQWQKPASGCGSRKVGFCKKETRKDVDSADVQLDLFCDKVLPSGSFLAGESFRTQILLNALYHEINRANH